MNNPVIGFLVAIALTACAGSTSATLSDVSNVEPGSDSAATSPSTDTATEPRSAPANVVYEGSLPTSPASGFSSHSLTIGGVTRDVGLYVPESLTTSAPLILAFHGTGGNPSDFLDELGLRGLADTRGLVVLAPQALERNGGTGEAGDPDHFPGTDGFWATSWNLADDSASTNDDLLLVQALVAEAVLKLGVDAQRVYAFGHSNGAFFAYHAAAVLSSQIAGFAENAGGAVRCDDKGPDGTQFVGQGTDCAALAAEPGYPTCAGPLSPVAPDVAGRVPHGFLAHHIDDAIVSVAWTCTLASALGDRAEVLIKAPDGDSFGHSVVSDFAARAWESLASRTLSD